MLSFKNIKQIKYQQTGQTLRVKNYDILTFGPSSDLSPTL